MAFKYSCFISYCHGQYDREGLHRPVEGRKPAADQVVVKGSVIEVTVAAQTVVTPSIVGLPLDQALDVLEQAQLSLGQVSTVYREVPNAKSGAILTQSPAAGAAVSAGSRVAVSVLARELPLRRRSIEERRVTMRTGFYRLLFALARVWWFIRRPYTEGAVAAIWYDGRVLLVESSYRPQFGLPGGFVRRGETHAQAASREVGEELRLQIAPTDLKLAWQQSTFFEYRHDTTTVWEITLSEPPIIEVDGREIVSVSWKTPAEARAVFLSPPVASYMHGRRVSG